MEEEDNIEDYLERALTVNRRSVFYIDENLQEISKELFENLGQAEDLSDENIVQSVARTLHDRDGRTRRIDALSLEVSSKDPSSAPAVTFKHSICISASGDVIHLDDPDPRLVIAELVNELIDHAVEVSVSRGPMYFFHPLAGREDVRQMTDTFMEARASLTDHASRLKAAMKIILVMSAKQIVVSYRRILMEQAERLEAGEEADTVAMETCQRCLEVTERVAEMAVIYLKRATQSVFDSSVHDVKITLGKLSDNPENKEIQAISRL